jgi:carboxylate-amine ligase
MLLNPVTYDLLPDAARIVGAVPRAVLELPAAQVELLSEAHETVAGACADLLVGRRAVLQASRGTALAAGAGAHPFASGIGRLNRGERYDEIRAEYATVAHRQLVFGLHVHVAIRPAERALAVFNGLRSYLPEIAALAANAPYYEGRDSGLASVRPKLSELLPRQGVPPSFASLEELAGAYAWGQESGVMRDRAQWWWEARLHPVHGTLEVRVPDTQTTSAETAAVAAFVHCLVVRLADRVDAGEEPFAMPTWRIEENRWSACRHGLRGRMADVVTGGSVPTRERLGTLAQDLGPVAAQLGCEQELAGAARMVQAGNGADRQRQVLARRGYEGLAAWLAERFTDTADPSLREPVPLAPRSAPLPAG